MTHSWPQQMIAGSATSPSSVHAPIVDTGPTRTPSQNGGGALVSLADRLSDAVTPQAAGQVDVGPDGGEFTGITSTEPITDWTDVFRRFNLDPDAFEIVGDTVRMSVWQQSKRTNDGDRDVVNLYSYRASFRRTIAGGLNLTELTTHLRNWTTTDTPAPATGAPEAFVVGLADWQLGKGEGDGTKGTVARLEQSLTNVRNEIHRLRAEGRNLTTLVLANLGDHTEGVAGSYASQTSSVDLNMRDQIQLALELNLLWIKSLATMFTESHYTACLCNHGQLSRMQGKDNITDDADNATGLIGDTLEKLCSLHDDLAHVQFTIPRDEMITTIRVAGVNIAMAHGQKISGREDTWLAAQSQYLTTARTFIPELWFTAHKHHAALTDYGPYTRIQATTVDPGSKWWTDSTGMYSRPGVTTFTVGAHIPGKWSDYRIL